jgi:bleomycin hydrolase
MPKAITAADLTALAQDLTQHPGYKVSQRAVTTNGIYAASENNMIGLTNTNIFSTEIETAGVTDQKQSGRCWLFATLNILRHHVSKEYKLDDFELSQSYLYFWDKLEKTNRFYEWVIDSAEVAFDDRWVNYIFDSPQADGGWWEYSAALIDKYGLVPKSAMPEAVATSKSGELNQTLNTRLRKDGLELRRLIERNATESEVQKAKAAMLSDVYRILTIAIGTPPELFDFVYKDKDKKYHRDSGLTPKEFLKKYIKFNVMDYVTLVNDPSKPYNATYAFEHGGGSVVGGLDVVMLNLPIETMKALTLKQLKAGEAVWFGCDIHASTSRKGYMSLEAYDIDATFGQSFEFDKADRIRTRDGISNHAMAIVGVDVVDGETRQWKIENSWGDETGFKGYYTMSDDWFDAHGYNVVIRRDLLTEVQRKILEKKPTIVPHWDPINLMPDYA